MNKQIIKQQLRRAFFALVIVGAILALPLADAVGAGAQTGTASGSSTGCFNTTDVSNVGSLTVLTASVTITFTGTFTGTFVGTDRELIYPNGSTTDHFSGVFTGTITTASGTTKSGSVLWNGVGEFATQPGKGVLNFEIDHGAGSLAGLHAKVSFEPTGGCLNCGGCEASLTSTYSGRFELVPLR